MQEASILKLSDVKPELKEIYDKAGTQENFNILPSSFYRQFSPEAVRVYMHQEAFYTLPTDELLDFLDEQIGDNSGLEICSGSGYLGKELDIPSTDLKLQERPDIKARYKLTMQPLIIYPKRVIKMDAVAAVKKYKPHTVISSYVTKQWDGIDGNMYSPDEREILKRVKKYTHIGSYETHANKPLMRKKHKTLSPDWLIVRGQTGFIGIWENK